MAKEKILVVEDEEDILELVSYNLTKNGYIVQTVDSGEKALSKIKDFRVDLILLDIMLPGIDGLEVCKQLKSDVQKTRDIPIIMLTAKGEEADIVVGLELGADDYITKPFSPRVLIARIKTVFRRRTTHAITDNSVINIDELIIEPGYHRVTVDNEQINLSSTEFSILHLLAKRPGWVFTRSQIIDSIRGDNYPVTDRSVDVQIVGLRKKLGNYGKYIETIRSIGYRFKG